jgi:hypothetical protein
MAAKPAVRWGPNAVGKRNMDRTRNRVMEGRIIPSFQTVPIALWREADFLDSQSPS